jgi:Rad3-related DNA helicase
MENSERIARIEQMEARMDRLQAAASALERALDEWEAAQPELEPLARYYSGPLWREDFAADEEGELPAELKRGVLSEDGLWNLLDRVRELNERLLEVESEES